ncbi:MAG TPA: iron hydrogenase small subunit [Candidatus Mailhella excrementigallinarum]|nr:iron hydrogenase small subunit [Candidatus Mailhella excrementigallinarum]
MTVRVVTRRVFLKAACMVAGGVCAGLRLTGRAKAAARELRDYMGARIGSVYAADAECSRRASQDNEQVKLLYVRYLDRPLSERSERLLHMRWTDRSGGVKSLRELKKYPHNRIVEFAGSGMLYPYEEEGLS